MPTESEGSSRWLVAALLALPFLVGIVVLRGLTVGIETFHSSDELIYHLPTIERFARELPGVGLVHYEAAQTPLFHLLFALPAKALGTAELWPLRLLNVAISYALTLGLYALLRRFRDLSVAVAATLALLFALSPYVYGTSFLLLTDSLAMAFVLATVGALLWYLERPALGRFALACLFVGLAVLTRQSSLWLAPLTALAALWTQRAPAPTAAPAPPAASAPTPAPAPTPTPAPPARDPRRLLAEALVLLLALAPYGALALAWGGLQPPDADPASCGLCGGRSLGDALTLRPALLTLALVGLYGGLLFLARLPRLATALRRERPLQRAALAGSAIGVALLLLAPMAPEARDAGFVPDLATHGPQPLGTSLIYWLLVPAGTTLLALATRRVRDPLPYALLACFLASSLVTSLLYQKYVDPIALLTVLLLVPRALRVERRDALGPLLLGLLFAGYALSFAG